MKTASAKDMRELYAGPLAEFVARRTVLVRRVRASGDRDEAGAVAALRKPTTAADAINRVVQAGHPAVAELVRLGGRLRQAQSALDARALATLRAPRDAVIGTWVEAAQQLSGPHTPAVQAEIGGTVIAALADAGAAEVVCSGVLTRTLSYSGFGEVDVSDAVARTSTGVPLTRLDGGRNTAQESGEEARASDSQAQAAEAAEAEAARAAGQEAVAAAEADVAAAQRERARCAQEVAQAERVLTQARRRTAAAQTAYQDAVRRRDDLTAKGYPPPE